MNTRQLVNPELALALESLPTLNPTAESLPALRASMASARLPAPPAPGVTVEEQRLPRPDGSVLRVLLYLPAERVRTGGLLFLHGGGMILATPEANDAQSRYLAHRLGCVVAAPDYRLAPEHPYPAALDDCYQVLRWLHEAADELQFPRQRLAVSGESGGGGLAAGLALLARDRHGPAISAQFLQYPMLDDRTGTPAEPAPTMPNAGEFIWTAASNRFAWRCVLGHAPGTAAPAPYAAPGRAGHLAGLPPCCLVVGELDLFVGENLRYAQDLIRQGVPTELHVYAGAYHSFMTSCADAAVSQRAAADFWGAMDRHFRGERPA